MKSEAYACLELFLAPSSLYQLPHGVNIEIVEDGLGDNGKATDGLGLIGLDACNAMCLDLGSRVPP